MRRKPDGMFRAVAAAILTWFALVIGGMIYVLAFNPATDLDRKCLRSSLAEMQACVNDYQKGKSP